MSGNDHVPHPGDSGDSGDPVDPVDPGNPSGGAGAGDPGEFAGPSKPPDATDTTRTIDMTGATHQTDRIDQTDQAEATGAAGTAEQTEPVETEPTETSSPPPSPPPPGPSFGQPPGAAPDEPTGRLHRSRRGRVVAGIAGGIGEHLGIDPVLPRVAFVVLTVFGGLGILLYLICWMLMPDEGERMSPAETLLGRGSRSRSVLAGDTVLAAIIAVVLVLYLSRHHGSDYVLLALVLGIGFVTYRHLETPKPPAGPGPGPGAPPPTPQPQQTPYATWRPTADDPPPGGMGAASLPPDWDTPMAGTRSATTRSPRAAGPRLTVVAFCLALILAGSLVALDRAFGLDLSPRTVLALLLALIGAALVVGAWWGHARGLILLGIPLAVVLMAASDPLLEDWGAHDQIWAPTSVSEISAVYRLSAGRGVLDLQNVDLAHANRQITVQMGAGDLRVKLPPDVDVRARGEVTMGSMTVLGSGASGVNQHRVVTDDGPDGPGGGRLQILAYLSFGHLEVIR